MANQPKKYQKFVATAATATLVASAIVPVASAAEKKFTDIEKYAQETQDAIYSLVDRGVITGKSDSIFAPAELITRGQVVKMMGRYLVNDGVAEVPTDWASKQRFTDLPVDFKDQDLVKNAAVVFDNGVFQGSNGKLNVSNNISRENMALVLDRAIGALNGKTLVELAKEEGLKGNVKDINSAKAEARDAIQALNAFGISEVDNFKPKNNVTRAQFALFLERTIDAVLSDTTEQLVEKAVVAGNALPKPEDVTKDNAADAQEKVDFAQRSLDKAQKALNEDKELASDEKLALQQKLDKVAEQIKAVKDAIEATKETAGITSVTAINDTKLEVKFGKAIDEDLVTEIEKSGERFVVYDGGQTANSSNVIKSETINFSSDRKTAEIILAEDELKTDIKYTVALMDGDNNEVASVVYKSAPTILKEGAGQPNISVDKEQEKLVLDFKTKMDESAKNVTNYKVFENNTEIGNLSDLVEENEGKWADATTKKAVEFTLKKNVEDGFLAGKTYKIKVSDTVETDDGKKLTSSQQTITFKTPSISEAQPVAKLARVVGDTISVTFDKDLAKDENFNARQVTVKKPSGETVKVNDVERGNGDKELIIKVDKLDSDLTYTIDMPANGVANAYFANASNKEVKGLKAQAQKNIEIKSMKAEFKSQTANKTKADLLLTFDQRPDVDSIDKVVVKEGTDKWELNTDGKVELYYGDTSGKTVIIKDVTDLDSKFAIESGKTYTVEIPYEGVKVDAGEGSKANQEKLKATANGVSTGDVSIDKVTLKSENEIEVRFDEDIDASNLKAKDVKVKGFEVYSNGNFTENAINLQGDSQLKLTSSGDTLTIKTANKNIKFVTSFDDLEIEIAKETIKNKSNDSVNEEAITLTGANLDSKDKIDRAAPVIVGGVVTYADQVELTYTEAVQFEEKADNAKAASQYTVAKASKNAYGVVVDSTNNTVKVTFNENETFKSDVDFSKIEVKYSKNVNVFAKDKKGNEVVNSTLLGLKGEGYNNSGSGTTKPSKPQTSQEIKDAANKAVNEAGNFIADGKDDTHDTVKNARTALNDALKDDTKTDEEIKALTDALNQAMKSVNTAADLAAIQNLKLKSAKELRVADGVNSQAAAEKALLDQLTKDVELKGATVTLKDVTYTAPKAGTATEKAVKGSVNAIPVVKKGDATVDKSVVNVYILPTSEVITAVTTTEELKFQLAPAKGIPGNNKNLTAAEATTYIETNYPGASINFAALEVTSGGVLKVKDGEKLITPAAWNIIKKDGNQDIPYRVTIQGIAKVLMNADGSVVFEDLRQ